ncbi:MAG: hypothetical protein WA951_14060 [Leeuwenhoekiella sp.]
MKNTWIDLQDRAPAKDGSYKVLIEGLGDRSTKRECRAEWVKSRFELQSDKLDKEEYIDKWKESKE